MTNDNELLGEFVENGSEQAFSELVSRHLPMVYSAAARLMPDSDLARDVAQSVFIDLAKKARSLRAHTSIVGWLHTSVRFAAARVRRDEFRRKTREHLASTMNTTVDDREWEQIAPALDQAVGELEAADQTAVLLRYFEGQELKRVGAALGVSEDAARMRVNRALEKLHEFLTKRGVTLSVAALGTLVAARSITAVPSGFERSVIASAVAAPVAIGFSFLRFWKPIALLGGLGIALLIVINSPAVNKSENSPTTASATGANKKPTALETKSDPIASAESNKATTPVQPRGLRFRAVEAETANPLPGVELRVKFLRKAGGVENIVLQTDEQGRATIEPPSIPFSAANMLAVADGHVPLRVWWRTEILPAEHTMKIPRATAVGGVVVDEDERPVANVRFNFTSLFQESVAHAEQVDFDPSLWPTTDANGRWEFRRIPTNYHSVFASLNHPEFATIRANIPDATNSIITLKRGVSISGTVRDMQGQLVEGATLRHVHNSWGIPEASTTSDALGRYRFDRVAPDEFRLAVQADARGLAPQLALLIVSNTPIEKDFVLEPGNIVRGRVVDEANAPISNASVRTDSDSEGLRKIEWSTKTGADGRFVWKAAPAVPLLFRVDADGFGGVWSYPIPPGPEVEIKLARKRPEQEPQLIRISGTVTDAVTKKPLEDFQVLLNQQPEAEHLVDSVEFVTAGNNGKFEVISQTPYPKYQLQVRKLGYITYVSTNFSVADGEQKLAITLKSGQDVAGIVLLPNDAPAVNANVFAYQKVGGVYMEKGGEFRKSGGVTQSPNSLTDEEGRFGFSGVEDLKGFIAIHDEGYAEVPLDQFSGHLKLQPWGRIKGEFRVGDRPGSNAPIWLGNMSYAMRQDDRVFGPLSLHIKTLTDNDGKFVFEKIPPGERRLFVEAPKPGNQMGKLFETQAKVIEVLPGEVTKVTLGGAGRRVIGRIAFDPEVAGPTWRAAVELRHNGVKPGSAGPQTTTFFYAVKDRAFWLSEEGRQAQRESRRYAAFCKSDGSFEIPDVIPAVYALEIELQKPAGGDVGPSRSLGDDAAVASINKEIVVTDNEVVDLGVIELKAQRQ